MKPLIPIVVSAGLALSSAQCHAADTHPLQPNAPRTVTVSEADTPPVIRVGLLQSTLIVLPAEEKVANVFAGDTVDWAFDGGHVASRFISVKPKVANGSTDIHIVSDHGNEYTLQLHEISSEHDAHFDSKVFIAPGDQVAKDRLTQLPVFVPAAELDKAKQEATTAKAAHAAELKAEEAKAEQYRSQYPGNLHFDYTWDQAKGKALGLQQIWRDDKFTYLRGQFQETPALYEVKDKKGSRDLTHFLLKLIVCSLLLNYWVNPFPGASFGINHFFSYIAQAMVAAFDQHSLDQLLQLLKAAGDGTSMPSLTAPVQILCYVLVQIMLGLASAILFVINCSAFILYGVTALFGPVFVPLLMTQTFKAKFFQFLDVLISFAMIRAVAAAFIYVWAGFMNGFLQQTFNGNYSMDMWIANLIPCLMVFVAFIINMLFIPSMTQAIFGGAAGMADGVVKVGGTVASIAKVAGGA